jgi:inorganic pyrophosphatase
VLISGFGYWQNTYENDHSELDIAILTDELPVHMYVD